MSVLVEVLIAGKAARRRLEIHRTSVPTFDENGHRNHDEIGTYDVDMSGGSKYLSASFEHRYGDDVFTLVAKAADALRATHSLPVI